MTLPGGYHIFADSGAPEGLEHYPTVVIIHGYVWHAGVFSRLLPLAPSRRSRIILLNRKEYPGAAPYTAEERALLPDLLHDSPTQETETRLATEKLQTFMKLCAQELYEYLQALVVERHIPPACRTAQDCGIVLAGWSLGACWMTALLTYVARFPVGDVPLREYIRRVILYDAPTRLLGYPYPAHDPYNPFADDSLTYEERERVFTTWITSYYAHGDTVDTLERRKPLDAPPPTIASISPEELPTMLHVPPGMPGGSDWALLYGGVKYDIFTGLRKGTIFLAPEPEIAAGVGGTDASARGSAARGDAWADVEVRYVWGECSVWEMPYAAMMLRQELEDARRTGSGLRQPRIRPVSILRVEGANHFAHWDCPDRVLDAFLTSKVDFHA
ncbi:hypothetical protein PYCCODRAFT_157874 [Trametes coccinea BRFM310]|uniref:Alpha/beta-hydrolase n=1 Tax=Trametes coccinea (strain BRFM310) TaxID=1353009 RepID=A0A1Y2IS22_TRAC3|nr:hypothetical protein PYCCODRAFT_157874 [Trametes coccinea BRFM310]